MFLNNMSREKYKSTSYKSYQFVISYFNYDSHYFFHFLLIYPEKITNTQNNN